MSEFSEVAEIIFSHCKKCNKDTQIAGNYKKWCLVMKLFHSACSFDLSTFWLLKSTPLHFQVVSYLMLSALHKVQRKYSVILQMLIHTSVYFRMSKSILFSQHISSAVSESILLFLQLFLLFCSITPLLSRCCNAQLTPSQI